MSPRERSFWWKIGYLVAIVVLLVPLFLLGHPATGDSEGSGGKLAQLRDDYQLSQKHLGQIDATSETIKLATLGLRPVAASILWGKANLYKKQKDWTNLEATVNQITSLQPNFIEIWVFQGWNLSYNVSAEFDGYRDRYHYVIQGINFLRQGMEYNRRQPRLPWEVGWFCSQKIGRADESKQFRRLFREDDKFHKNLPVQFQVLGADPRDNALARDPRDNWLVGKKWFYIATDMVDTTGEPMKGKGPLIYRSSAPMCQMNYADTLETEGRFNGAQLAWQDAANEWDRYGSVDIPTYGMVGDDLATVIQLNDLDRGRNYLAQIRQAQQELDALEPGLREKTRKEREAKLTPQQRQALDVATEERTATQRALAEEAQKLLDVTDEDLAKAIRDPDKRARAAQLLKDLDVARIMADVIRHRRETINFDYWRLRADVEQTEEAVAAHEWIYNGDQDMEEGRLQPAKSDFDHGLAAWRKVLDKFPEAVADEAFGEDLMEVIGRYRRLLGLRDEKQQRDATYGKDLARFSVGLQHQTELDAGAISAELRGEFADQQTPLSDDASVSVQQQGSKWSIADRTALYEISKEADTLDVVKQFILADIVRLHGKEEAGATR